MVTYMALLLSVLAFCAVVLLAVITLVVAYHFDRFGIEKNRHRIVAGVFLVGSCVFIIAEIVLLRAVSWDDVLQSVGGRVPMSEQDFPLSLPFMP